MHFFSVGDSSEKAQTLFESAKFFNIDLKFLEANPWTGYYEKIRHMKQAIKDLPSTDLIVFMDAYDVIITSVANEMCAKFQEIQKESGADLVFSAELNCWPEKYKAFYPADATRFLNSGTYMGTQAALMELFTWKSDAEIQEICEAYTDQGYVHEYYAAHPGKIVLDIKSRLFQCMYFIWWREFLIMYGRPYNTVMEQTPCIMHFNGHSWRARALNVMPIFLERMRISAERDCIATLGDIKQYMYAETYTIPPQKRTV